MQYETFIRSEENGEVNCAEREGSPAAPLVGAIMHLEYELKMSLSPEQLAKLPRNRFLSGLTRKQGPPQRLISAYFDTPKGALRNKSMALRVRRSGKKRVQTLKVQARQSTGLQNFEEYETEISGDTPILERIENRGLRAKLKRSGMADQLEEVFRTDFARRKRILRLDDTEIEMALDRGTILSGEKAQPICEAELELVSGCRSRVFEVALALLEKVPFRIEHQTKASRGYTLASGHNPSPVLGKKPDLQPDLTVVEAFLQIAHACMAHITGNEAAVLAGTDPEGVHQMRVGVRRLRALVQAFNTALAPEPLDYLRNELRWLQQELGPARDWDVFLTQTLPPILERIGQDPGLLLIRDRAIEARKLAYETAHAAVHDVRYARLLLQLGLWLEEPSSLFQQDDGYSVSDQSISTLATAVLDRRDDKLRKLGERHKELTMPELHNMRIRTKKIRYAADFFKGAVPGTDTRRYLRGLSGLQDCLGTLNDAEVTSHLLDQLDTTGTPKPKNGKASIVHGRALILGWVAARMDQDLKDLGSLWSRFSKTKPFWS